MRAKIEGTIKDFKNRQNINKGGNNKLMYTNIKYNSGERNTRKKKKNTKKIKQRYRNTKKIKQRYRNTKKNKKIKIYKIK